MTPGTKQYYMAQLSELTGIPVRDNGESREYWRGLVEQARKKANAQPGEPEVEAPKTEDRRRGAFDRMVEK